MPKLLIANWKSYLDHKQTLALTKKYKTDLISTDDLEIVVAPNELFLEDVATILKNTKIKLAGQNLALDNDGKNTGEVRANDLVEVGCSYVLIGHSERRHKYNETDEIINQKIKSAYSSNLIPILCVGETLAEKNNNKRDEIIANQLKFALSKINFEANQKLIIAYEPVWAIGSGQVLPVEELAVIKRLIKRSLANLYSEHFFDDNVQVLYGGSLKADVAGSFWQSDSIDGLLVGGASLDINEIKKIALL